jgi:hypothetical protein
MLETRRRRAGPTIAKRFAQPTSMFTDGELIMRSLIILLLAATPLSAGCAASFPPPTQHMADAESATRSAKEVGADAQPAARLEVKLADEQIAQAKLLVTSGDNKRADFVLMRARADAELGLALAREQGATTETQKTIVQSSETLNANTQGARP